VTLNRDVIPTPITVSEMLRAERIREIRELLAASREKGRRIGFVPTMGAMHAGHLSLVHAARGMSDEVVVSVFVNPLQFGPSEDFEKYPRDLENDAAKAAAAGATILFAPSIEEIYPAASSTVVVPGPAAARWEGEIRPGHFQGVLTVVAKLFNIVEPDVALFGQKDWQQATVVIAMVRDLHFPIEVTVLPTVRDADGLAMSSRNAYLTPSQRATALAIPRSLATILGAWQMGEVRSAALIELASEELRSGGIATSDYCTVVSPASLEPVPRASEGDVALIAARVGGTRLIDNVILTHQSHAELRASFPPVR